MVALQLILLVMCSFHLQTIQLIAIIIAVQQSTIHAQVRCLRQAAPATVHNQLPTIFPRQCTRLHQPDVMRMP